MSDSQNLVPAPAPEELPKGDHPLEIAARRGIGPLSPLGEDAWHGHARPCVSCGLLVLRDQRECDHCGQDLSDEMIERMKAHAGPWYVLEHLRPFPGVSLERILRQIRRGVLTETSIIRGPSTDFQWRFAVETPGICLQFGKCWNCQSEVVATDTYCKSCLCCLAFQPPAPKPGVADPQMPTEQDDTASAAASTRPASIAPPTGKGTTAVAASANIEALRTAVRSQDNRRANEWDEPPRIGGIRAIWIALIMLILVVIALVWMTNQRSAETRKNPESAAMINRVTSEAELATQPS